MPNAIQTQALPWRGCLALWIQKQPDFLSVNFE